MRLFFTVCLLLFVSPIVLYSQPGAGTDWRPNPFTHHSDSPHLLVPIEQRVKDLLNKMTIEEKIAQLQCEVQDVEGKNIITEKGIGELGVLLGYPSAKEAAEKANRLQKFALEKTRLGIPILIHNEALHGLVANGATSFPQAIGLASTWNAELMETLASAIGKETRSRGIRQVLSPVINIARDVRWGRVEETYGEDPYLTSRMGVAFCRGIEREGVISTPKHFAANVGDGGRDSNPIHFSERLLREIYFPAFKACFQEANAGAVMAAFNSLDGLPCSANPWLLTDILRNEWGFKGFVVSDYDGVTGIMRFHHLAGSPEETAKQAIEAGMDVELPDIDYYGKPLLQAVTQGLVAEATLDQAVSRILEAKFRLGLFENPYVDPDYAAQISDCKEHRALALQAAREAIVLLKNDDHVLPLNKNLKSIAVIGPNADAVQLGGYCGWGMRAFTLLEGIKQKVPPTTQVYYAKGCDLKGVPLPPIPAENLLPPHAKPGEHGLRAEYFNNMDLTGEPVLVRIDQQIDFDWGYASPAPTINADSFSVRWTGKLVPAVGGVYKLSMTTDDGVRLYIDDELLVDSWYNRAPTPDVVTIKLEAGRQYDIRVESYENEWGAYASLGWGLKPDGEKEFDGAVEAAEKADAAIVVVGIFEGEGKDRAFLELPGAQEELIRAVSKTGTPTIVVLINGSAVTMQRWIYHTSAIVEAWYPGEEGGNAIAEVVFGDYNPGGRLPITFPQAVGQLPLYYNYKPSGRGYDYVGVSERPLFPFGHGLGYTKFAYSNLELNPRQINPTQKMTVRVNVQNIGARKGDEVVQLYLRDVVASVARPVKELKGFKRITLEPGEKQIVTFELTPEHLSFYDRNMKLIVEPGVFKVMIGSSSENILIEGEFTVVGEKK